MRSAKPDRVIRDVGRRVAEGRMRRGLTQEQLAEEAGVSLKYLQRVEAGKENLTVQSLVKLANLLRVEVIELFKRPRSARPGPGRPPRKR